MKRILALVFSVLLAPAVVVSGEMPVKYRVALSEGGAGLVRGLTFHAPLTDPANSLTLHKGTGSLSFTRATTATYLHPTTGIITSAGTGVLRVESSGALIEGERTNILLRSRTLNNAAWTATNTSADNTITGEDGVENSASWVAASSDNGMICQPVTIASAAYSGAFSLKRITGTGTVKISLDNGATWGSDLAGSLSTSAWYRASKANQTLANPEICLQLGTSGDNVAVDYAQVEAGAFGSSRIPTTSAAVTRNADVLTFPSSGNLSGTLATVSFEFDAKGGLGLNPYLLDFGTDHAISGVGTALVLADGTNTNQFVNPGSWSGQKWAGRWETGVGMSHLTGGVPINDTAFDGDMNVNANPKIGGYSGGVGWEMFGHIKNLRIWSRALTDAEMVGVTQ